MAGPMDAAVYAARQEADGITTQAQADFPKLSFSAREWVDRADQSHSARLGELLCGRPLPPVLLVYPRLGREEDSVPLGKSQTAPRFRMEEVAREWLYGTLGLFHEYRVVYQPPSWAAAPTRLAP